MFYTYLDLLYRFGRHISGDDFPCIRLTVAKVTLLWQPVKYGRCSHTSGGVTLCFGIRQWIADHKSAFKRLNGNSQATSCTNLVNFHSVILEFMLLKCAIFAAIRRNMMTIFIPHVGVSKWIGRSQF